LSQQPVIGKGNEIYKFIPENSFIVQQDIFSKINPVGYITTNGETSYRNSTALAYNSGDNSQYETDFRTGSSYANNFTGHKFFELICDTAIYNKFIKFCDWQICKKTNTANVFNLSYAEYEKTIEEDLHLHRKIYASKFAEIFIQVGLDYLETRSIMGKIGDAIKKYGGNVEKIIEALEKYRINTNTSLQDYLVNHGSVFLTYGIDDAIAKYVAKQFIGCSKTLGMSMSNIISGKNNETVGDKTVAEYIKDFVRSKDHNQLETENAQIIKLYRDAIFSLADNCLPASDLYILKKHWMYHVFKNLPEFSEAAGLVVANATIKYSISKEYKEILLSGKKRDRQKSNAQWL
jgi:hypothetical protein